MLTKISSKINFIGGMLSLIVIVNIILTFYLNKKQEGDAYIINIAGRQRMLSQKITKEIFYIKNKNNINFQILNNDIDIFDKNLHILISGNDKLNVYKAPNKEIKNQLNKVLSIWIPFKNKIIELEKYTINIKNSKEIMMNKFDDILKISNKVVKKMVKEKLPRNYIDLSGRQRMLSQKMGLYLVRYLDTSSQNYFYTYNEAMQSYNKTILSFINDNLIKNKKQLFNIVNQNFNYWKNFKKYTDNLIKKENQIQKNIQYIDTNNIKLLQNMDKVVWLYTNYSEGKNNFIKNFLYISAVLTLLIIFYTFFTAKIVERHIEIFVNRTKKLSSLDPTIQNTPLTKNIFREEELKEASTHINKFADKVKNAFELSNEAFKKAEMTANELQTITDNIEMALRELNVKDQNNFSKDINETEDIAIESIESLIKVSKMIKKLKNNLSEIIDSYPNKISEK